MSCTGCREAVRAIVAERQRIEESTVPSMQYRFVVFKGGSGERREVIWNLQHFTFHVGQPTKAPEDLALRLFDQVDMFEEYVEPELEEVDSDEDEDDK